MIETDRIQNWRRQLQRMKQDPDGLALLGQELGIQFASQERRGERPLVIILIASNRQPKPLAQDSWEKMIAHARKSMDVYAPTLYGHSVIHWTRDEMLASVYQKGKPYTHVFLLDDDMEVAEDTLDKLMSHQKDIVSGLCTNRCLPAIPTLRTYNENTGDFDQKLQWKEEGLMQVDGVGAACMLISKRAIELIGSVWLDFGYEQYMGFDNPELIQAWKEKRLREFNNDKDTRWFKNGMWFQFLPAMSGRGEYGEDLSFCLKAKLVNIPVYVDTTVTPKHIGDYGYSVKEFYPYRDQLVEKSLRDLMFGAACGQWPYKTKELVKGEPTKKVSVLLPSRGRPQMLEQCITKLLATAWGDVEVLVRLDDDDEESKALHLNGYTVSVAVGPRFGYPKLHEYYNELAAAATGDWLIVWNDDAEMLTPGWDTKIHEFGSGLKLLNMTGKLNLFPIFSRQLYETIGHVSLNAHCDSWLQVVARMNGIEYPVDVDVKHLREEIDDATKAETQASYQTQEFFSPEVQGQLYEDCLKVKKALKGNA